MLAQTGSHIQSQIEFSEIMTSLDWVVFCLVLMVTFASVIYGQYQKRKHLGDIAQINHSSEELEKANFLDLILMGRKLTLPMFIATLVATWYGGIFGVTEIAFNHGIYNFITQGLFWYMAYIIFAFFLIHKIAPYRAVTLPDLIGKMFGPKSAYLGAIFNFFNVLPIAYIISLGLFGQLIFGGSLFLNMLIGIIVVMGYSLLGGFRAVVFSDLIQFFVMCSGVFLALAISVSTFGGLDFLKANLPASHFQLTSDQGVGLTLVWGFIALSTLVDPNFYQRCFAAKSPLIAKRGILISTGIWFVFDICTTFGAMYARAVIPDAPSGLAYLIYVVQIVPDGLRGFFLAGILATILSTLDSYIFLAGTTLAHDLVPPRWRGRPHFFHLGVFMVGAIGLMMAVIFEGNIKMVWRTLGSYSAACLLFPVIFGHLFPKRISDIQFVTTCTISALVVTVWRLYPLNSFWGQIDALYAGLATTSILIFSSLAFNTYATQKS